MIWSRLDPHPLSHACAACAQAADPLVLADRRIVLHDGREIPPGSPLCDDCWRDLQPARRSRRRRGEASVEEILGLVAIALLILAVAYLPGCGDRPGPTRPIDCHGPALGPDDCL